MSRVFASAEHSSSVKHIRHCAKCALDNDTILISFSISPEWGVCAVEKSWAHLRVLAQ